MSLIAGLGNFLCGANMLASMLVSFFFFRFYLRNRDRLLCFFGWAFLLMGIERWALLVLHSPVQEQGEIYIVRLVAYLLIIYGIIDKNKKKGLRDSSIKTSQAKGNETNP